jgi:CBS domain-containing protein
MSTIQDVMTTRVMTVGRRTPLKEVAQLLVDNKISGMPVIDLDRTVLGVISEADFLVKEGGPDAVRHRPLARLLGESRASRTRIEKLNAIRAADAMTAPAITIESSRPISEAARIMIERRINRLPVVDDGRLVGIVTRADLVRAYVRSDIEIADTIRLDVFARTLWLDPSSFAIDVKEGVVSISGHVERLSTAEMIEQAIATVPGVVGVNAAITWSIDDSTTRPAAGDLMITLGSR